MNYFYPLCLWKGNYCWCFYVYDVLQASDYTFKTLDCNFFLVFANILYLCKIQKELQMRNFMTYMMVAHNFVHIILNSFFNSIFNENSYNFDLISIYIYDIIIQLNIMFFSRNKEGTIIDICKHRNCWHLSAFEMAP